jgi:hypothetical protein
MTLAGLKKIRGGKEETKITKKRKPQAIDYNENKMTLAGLKKIRDAWTKTRADHASTTIALGELQKKKKWG